MQRDHTEAYTILNAGRVGQSPLLLVCDHASNALPQAYGTLGLPPDELSRHIAWDPGAADLTRALANRLGAPALLSCFSRLLIDLNRGDDDPTLVMRLSDGAIIPGNRHVTPTEIETRLARYWRPYHDAITTTIDQSLAAGLPPVIVSIHTFTPVWRGAARPWHAGILWDKDDRLANILLEELSSEPALIVGDNAPYHGWLKNDCLYQHGTSRGLAHALVEIRNDLLATPEGVAQWTTRLTSILQRALADPDTRKRLTTVQMFGSRAG